MLSIVDAEFGSKTTEMTWKAGFLEGVYKINTDKEIHIAWTEWRRTRGAHV
jgi:hypothetical protein